MSVPDWYYGIGLDFGLEGPGLGLGLEILALTTYITAVYTNDH